MKSPFSIFAILFGLLAGPGIVWGGQINWSSTPISVNRYSNGALMDEQMVFELGVFAAGFTPTAANTAQWAQNWRRASLVHYTAQSRFFTSIYNVVSNAAPFSAGTRGYIWGHTGQRSGGEWLLMTHASWNWPGTGPLDLPVNWTVSTIRSSDPQPVVGAVSTGGVHMQTALVDAPLPVVPWTEWQQTLLGSAPPTAAGMLADYDGDGLKNLEEYFFGTNPSLLSQRPPGFSYTMTGDGTRPRLTMTLPKRADRLATGIAEASLDLSSWPPASVQTVSDTANATVFRENLTSPGAPQAFMRLKITAP